jgi:hypothetical protein
VLDFPFFTIDIVDGKQIIVARPEQGRRQRVDPA